MQAAYAASALGCATSAQVLVLSSSSSEIFLMPIASLVGTILTPTAMRFAGSLTRRAMVASSCFLVGRASHFFNCGRWGRGVLLLAGSEAEGEVMVVDTAAHGNVCAGRHGSGQMLCMTGPGSIAVLAHSAAVP
jgi:hypothetical protein